MMTRLVTYLMRLGFFITLIGVIWMVGFWAIALFPGGDTSHKPISQLSLNDLSGLVFGLGMGLFLGALTLGVLCWAWCDLRRGLDDDSRR